MTASAADGSGTGAHVPRSVGLSLVVLGLLGTALAWLAGGWSYAVLASSSMEPWASPGDLLLHRHVPASQIEAGDVVTVPSEDGRLVTHRVVELADADQGRVARLKGDRSRLPDPVPVDLVGDVARVDAVVPRLGDVLTLGGPLLWGGMVLLVVGGVALGVARRRTPPAPPGGTPTTQPPTTGAARGMTPDPRVEALLATCEQLAEDGVAPVVLRDVVRVRVAAVAGLPPAERAGIVLALDDGARFYVLACADADADALALVPVGSERRRAATAALDAWWDAVGDRLPPAEAEAIAAWTRSG